MVTWLSPVQKRMAQLDAQHKREVDKLNKRLSRMSEVVRIYRAGYNAKHCIDQDDVVSEQGGGVCGC